MTQKEIQPYILPGLLVIGVIYILNKFGSTNYIYLLSLKFSATDQKIL